MVTWSSGQWHQDRRKSGHRQLSHGQCPGSGDRDVCRLVEQGNPGLERDLPILEFVARLCGPPCDEVVEVTPTGDMHDGDLLVPPPFGEAEHLFVHRPGP